MTSFDYGLAFSRNVGLSTAVLVAAASAGAAVWWLDQGTLDPCRGAHDCVQAP